MPWGGGGKNGPYLPMKDCYAPIWVWDMHEEYQCRDGVDQVCYLSCSEGLSCRTSSHRWDRLYLPRFLLKEGSFTQMYMASWIVLVAPVLPCRLWWSIPNPNVWNLRFYFAKMYSRLITLAYNFVHIAINTLEYLSVSLIELLDCENKHNILEYSNPIIW